jgi:hypothetical protein
MKKIGRKRDRKREKYGKCRKHRKYRKKIEKRWHHSRSGDLFFGNGVLSWVLERLGSRSFFGVLGLVCEK